VQRRATQWKQWNKTAAGRKAQEDAPLRFSIDRDATCLRSDLDNSELQLVMNVTYGKSGHRLYGWNVGWDGGGGWCSKNYVVGLRHSTFEPTTTPYTAQSPIFILV
jgi:hypothetical protein